MQNVTLKSGCTILICFDLFIFKKLHPRLMSKTVRDVHTISNVMLGWQKVVKMKQLNCYMKIVSQKMILYMMKTIGN